MRGAAASRRLLVRAVACALAVLAAAVAALVALGYPRLAVGMAVVAVADRLLLAALERGAAPRRPATG